MKLPINYKESHWAVRKQAREQYCIIQMWKCCHCKEDLMFNPPKHIMDKPLNMKLFPKGMLDHPIHLHHCHKTGMTIGAVHAKCNAVLWQYYGE
ncbi:hypothetical protein NVP1084O_102 [Vibrio phage 1.084.O._10N.261.49.F5]|nr:hypothetical protein NVP1084O_102 [Vibrio phage 1.084.O._10N.261.49.F5]